MPSITEKINQLEAPEGELGKHYKTKINMEAEIEKLLRPTPTYLLMRYALQCRLTAEQTHGEFKGVLTLHDNCIAKYRNLLQNIFLIPQIRLEVFLLK